MTRYLTPASDRKGLWWRDSLAVLVVILMVLAAVLALGDAEAHPERMTTFPTADVEVPEYRTTGGRELVVCKPESREKIWGIKGSRLRAINQKLLNQCAFEHIQDAVDAARNHDRIYILPGEYTEPRSRATTETPECAELYRTSTHGDARKDPPDKYLVATYEYQRQCPNARNLVAIMDDPDGDGECDKCHLQIEGTGAAPEDVVILGSRGPDAKYDIVHVDRAHGIYLRNFTVQFGKFNGINVIETSGYRLEDIVSRYNENYGILTFTTINGLYNRVTAHHNGHAGLYPGSTAKNHNPDGTCGSPSIEMREVESYGNTYGYSGTGGNSVWVHHSRFHNNATGLSTDSVASAHPGMPQECSAFEDNEFFSNNLDVFDEEHRIECSRPWSERPPATTCPYWAAPVGTGVQIAGGNSNLVRRNRFYDNRRAGVYLFWIPAPVRNELDPRKLRDTSNHNTFVDNVMGRAPSGEVSPNGVDFWWDEQGYANCWSRNVGIGTGGAVTSDPVDLPACEEPPTDGVGNPLKWAEIVPCALFDPRMVWNPPACTWTNPEWR